MGNTASSAEAPLRQEPLQAAAAPSSSSACPVIGDARPLPSPGASAAVPGAGARRGQPVYNVYNQRIDADATVSASGSDTGATDSILGRLLGLGSGLDPVNQMPREPNQAPAPGQRRPLPTARQLSSIPKGGTETAWLYPSPQMFYNALKRKNKGDDVTEADMAAVVSAHNGMNEATWRRLLQWEALHHECGRPTLVRFLGRPDDISPLARIRSWFGGPLPFDRHDWYVDRCGRDVRYVIDFYFNDDKAGTDEAFELCVRPALDSPTAALDRVKMTIYTKFAEWGLPCPVTGHSQADQRQADQRQGQTARH